MDSTGSNKVKRTDLLAGYMSNNSSSSSSSNDYSSFSKLKSHDSGYYDGSYYKSKYDDLLSDVTSSRQTPRSVAAYTGSSTSRQLKPYKRTDSSGETKHRTAINLYELLDNEPQSSAQSTTSNHRRHYSKGKSTGNSLLTVSRYDTDDSADDFAEIEKTERENRRKEIQSLIQKYAQMDDFYGKASTAQKKEEKNDSVKLDPWEIKAQSPVTIPSKKASTSSSSGFNALGKSQTMATIAAHHYQNNHDTTHNSNNNLSNNYDSSWYENSYNRSRNKSGHVVPITTYAPKSSSKSRMSKALSTFVSEISEFIFCL